MDMQARSEKIIAAFKSRGTGFRTLSQAPVLERVRNGKRLVFTAEPGYVRNPAGEIIGVDAWVELYDESGNEIPIDPHRRIINPPTVPRANVTETTTEDGFVVQEVGDEDPYEAFIEAVWDSVESAPYPQGWRTAGTVTTIYGDTSDGRLEGQGASYSTARQGSGTIAIDTTGTASATGQFFSSTYSCYQQFWAFDTSAITDSDEVTGVTLELYQTGQNLAGGNFTVEAREFDWGASLTTADYRAGSTLANYTLLATIDTSGMGTLNTYYALTSTSAFLTAANLKTGTVRLFTSSSRQRLNQAPSDRQFVQFATANASGTTTDPKLTITHSSVVNVENTFDGGSNNTTITTGNSGGSSGTAFTQVVGSPRYTNEVKRGSLSAVNPTVDADAHLDWQNIVNGDVLYTRFYLYLTGAPSGWQRVLVVIDEDSQFPYALWISSGRDLALYWKYSDSNLYTFDNKIPLNQWVRIETYANLDSSGYGDVQVWLYLNPDSTTPTEASGTFTGSWGTGSPRTVEFHTRRYSGGFWYLDDVAAATSKIGPGATYASGGSSTSTSHTVSGSGRPGPRNGSGTTLSVSVAASGSPGPIDGSSVIISSTAEGSGGPALSDGSSASVDVTGSGSGSPAVSGGSSADASVSVSSGGAAGFSGGSDTSVDVTVSTGGIPGFEDGSSVTITVTAAGGGSGANDASGGSDVLVEVDVSGGGSPNFSGGSSELLTHTVEGSGSAGFSGGSSVTVTHTVSGAGRRLLVDVSVEVGPTVVLRRFELGPSRTGVEAGDNRLSMSVADNLLREPVRVSSSAVRERVSVEATRLSAEIGENRLGLDVDPSRVTRLE